MKKLPGVFWIGLASALVSALIGFLQEGAGIELVVAPLVIILLETFLKVLQEISPEVPEPPVGEWGVNRRAAIPQRSLVDRVFWG